MLINTTTIFSQWSKQTITMKSDLKRLETTWTELFLVYSLNNREYSKCKALGRDMIHPYIHQGVQIKDRD